MEPVRHPFVCDSSRLLDGALQSGSHSFPWLLDHCGTGIDLLRRPKEESCSTEATVPGGREPIKGQTRRGRVQATLISTPGEGTWVIAPRARASDRKRKTVTNGLST
jgi:hypothetical protein